MGDRKYRVIQVATGTVGTHGMRTILGRRDMELVGLYVYTPEKVGRDAGDIVGCETTGVAATDSFDEILQMEADAVAYAALGETLDADKSLDEICRLLESGKNVCSTAVSTHVYPLGHSRDRLMQRLQAACEKGGVSFHSTGVNPGYMMDVLPVVLSRVSRRIDLISMTELVNMSNYPSKQVNDFMGFGKYPDEVNAEVPKDLVLEGAFYTSMKMVADGTGLEIDDVRHTVEGRPTSVPIDIATGRIEAGRVAVVRNHVCAYRRGRVVIDNQWVWRVSDDVAPEWPAGNGAWEVRIEGDPNFATRLESNTSMDAGQPDVLMTGAHAVNAIPSLCDAAVGVQTDLDLPLFGGGFFGAVDDRS